MKLSDEIRDDLYALTSCATDETSDAADRVRAWLEDWGYEDPDQTLTNRRDLDGKVLTVTEVRDFERQGYRTYSVDCSLSFPHTKHGCHNADCPED